MAGRTGGVRELAGGNPPNVHSRLRGELILAGGRGASRPVGRIRHRGTGGHRDVGVATLVERVPAPYSAGPARRGGQCS